MTASPEVPPLVPGMDSRPAPGETLLLRPVVLGQVIDESVSPIDLQAAIPRARIDLIIARSYNPDGSRVGVTLYQNGVLTGNTALFPPGAKVEFAGLRVVNAGLFKGRLLVRYRNANTNALLQEIQAVPETNPGSAIDFCIGVGDPGCSESTITMPDGPLSLKIEAGHL